MRLVLKGPGGLGGLQIEGQLDTKDLPPHLAQRAARLLDADHLRTLRKSELSSSTSQMADPEMYTLALPETGYEDTFQSSDSPDDLMALLADLMHEIIVRKAKHRKP